MLQNFLGGQDEEWFVLIHVAIEAAAVPGLAAVAVAQEAAGADRPDALAEALLAMASTLETLNSILSRMPERCDPYIYFRRVRPYNWKLFHPMIADPAGAPLAQQPSCA